MAEKPTPYDDLSWIKTDGISKPTQSRPADGVGRWEYWQGTFKQAFDGAGEAGFPFSNAEKGGLNEWEDTGTPWMDDGDKARLLLENSDGSTTSGWVTFTMAQGWQGMFYVITENNDFFEDNVKGDFIRSNWIDDDAFINELNSVVNDLEDEGWPSVWVQDNAENTDSRMVTGLDSGDYISFDIDGESSEAAQSRVRIGGEDYLSNTEPDNEVWITCMYLRYWNAAYEWPADPNPDPDPEPPEPDPDDDCPEGYEKNEFGICVLVTPPEPKDCPAGFVYDADTDSCVPIKKPEDDITTGEMIAVIAGIAGVIFLAIKVI